MCLRIQQVLYFATLAWPTNSKIPQGKAIDIFFKVYYV